MNLRWPDGKVRMPALWIVRPAYVVNAKVFKCYQKHEKQKFSLEVETVFEDSPLGLDKWLVVMRMLVKWCPTNSSAPPALLRKPDASCFSVVVWLYRTRSTAQTLSAVEHPDKNHRPPQARHAAFFFSASIRRPSSSALRPLQHLADFQSSGRGFGQTARRKLG